MDVPKLTFYFFSRRQVHKTTSFASGASSQLKDVNEIVLPAKLSDDHFQSLADAVQSLVNATVPLAEYANSMCGDVEGMIEERNHYVALQAELNA